MNENTEMIDDGSLGFLNIPRDENSSSWHNG